MSRPTAVIVDMDGTLADKITDRKFSDWERVGEDVPYDDIIDLVYILEKVYRILVVSGRMEAAREPTRKWLRKYAVPYDCLYMRANGDFRSDEIVKEEIFHNEIEPHYDVKFVIDDRNKVVKMWRRIGLRCLQVQEGDF